MEKFCIVFAQAQRKVTRKVMFGWIRYTRQEQAFLFFAVDKVVFQVLNDTFLDFLFCFSISIEWFIPQHRTVHVGEKHLFH
jgi:hypothetical protein